MVLTVEGYWAEKIAVAATEVEVMVEEAAVESMAEATVEVSVEEEMEAVATEAEIMEGGIVAESTVVVAMVEAE